ncbi:unnamed protein product [Linum tenue]|uniref:Uncharacterized protein n=1 Tax=Linum tenue TaxID=586396 RepID=A0AAV0NGR0_9ROSI|nr:unnamed protein product [Linum tenue]
MGARFGHTSRGDEERHLLPLQRRRGRNPRPYHLLLSA